MKTFPVLFENEEIILINKESGVAVQGGKGIFHPLDQELSESLGYRIHLVHRLDKETSGILVVAKNSAAASKWTRLIGEKDVRKEYVALCVGTPAVGGKKCDSGTLEDIVEAHGRHQKAVLHFKVEEKFFVEIPRKEGDENSGPEKIEVSRIRIVLGTGRMHQIRIQMAKSGCPIVADDQHGDFKANKKLRRVGMKKLCLAAVKLTVPLGKGRRTFEIPLPGHMNLSGGR